MSHLSGSELLLYGGIAVMAFTAVSAVVCIAAFSITRRKLKEQLEKEYGKLSLKG